MSTKTEEILDRLKAITLLEASELVTRIEETFGVDATPPLGGFAPTPPAAGEVAEVAEEKTTFDVILEEIVGEKRVAVLKAIRNLTSLGLKEAKDFTSSLPKAVKESVSKEEAEEVKKQLEASGGKVRID